jgi:ribosome biogenesis SPOUT family RNA methylase Rps3
MSQQPNPLLREVSQMRGLGPQMLFAVDTQSKPGKWIVHFVRLETIEFENNDILRKTTFQAIHPDNDARLHLLTESIRRGKS